jgi:hypothetical protein
MGGKVAVEGRAMRQNRRGTAIDHQNWLRTAQMLQRLFNVGTAQPLHLLRIRDLLRVISANPGHVDRTPCRAQQCEIRLKVAVRKRHEQPDAGSTTGHF